MERKKLKERARLFFARCVKGARAQAKLLVLLLAVFAILSVLTAVSFFGDYESARIDLDDFEVGAVSDRDVVLSNDLSYVDEEATAIRREARMNLVAAVFEYLPDTGAPSGWQAQFFGLLRSLGELGDAAASPRTAALEAQDLYPGAVPYTVLESFFALPQDEREEALQFASYFYNSVSARGLASFPDEGMENFSQTEVEVIRNGEHITMERSALLTRESLPSFLNSEARAAGLDPSLESYVMAIVSPFLRENLVYRSHESERKLSIALESVSPVLVVIPQGERIVRRGFVVTEESYARLEHLARSGSAINMARLAATELFLLALIAVSVFVLSAAPCKNLLLLRYRVFLAALFCIIYALGLTFTHIPALQSPIALMLALPTALFSMLTAILLNRQAAIAFAFALSAAVFVSSGFSPEPMLFSMLSGVASVAAIRDTGRRLDLVRSAALMGVFSAVFAFIIAVAYQTLPARLPFYAGVAALNGFLSGILIIGLLPLLERMLNAVTSFRLMELSDLNTPLMQKMLLTVPGTYNHTQMVASLAEDACRAIGANALLARVGAHYHDIGKMEQGEYFVENQHGENKHDELPPRISATIIRSHVKQGVEKARNLKLPQEVIDIIAEHHGNSVIAYFYNKAKQEDPDANPEDFMYPGNPPSTKESAVVMLADTVEAACRTLEKPTMPRLEKFIDELVRSKIEHGQLAECDLTFRDLDTIKKSFVNLLVGYYHSRIEYPDQKDPDGAGKAQGKEEASERGASAKSEEKGKEKTLQPSAAQGKEAPVKPAGAKKAQGKAASKPAKKASPRKMVAKKGEPGEKSSK